MTSISSVGSNNSQRHPQIIDTSKAEIRQALAQIESELSGTQVKPADIKIKGVSEERLFVALIFSELNESKPNLARQMRSELAARVKNLQDSGHARPLYGAVQEMLTKAVQEGKISKAMRQSLVHDGFGMAQLDNRLKRLAPDPHTRPTPTTESTPQTTTTTNADQGASTISEPTPPKKLNPAQNKPLAEALESATTRDSATKAQVRDFRKWLKAKNQPKETQAPPPPPPPAAAPPIKTETDVLVPLDDVLNFNSGPNDLTFRPRSEKDGNALVQIPLPYVDEVNGVEIRSGNSSYAFRYTGRGDDGRTYWRADKSGQDFGLSFTVRLRFTDNTYYDVSIDNSNNFHVVSFYD